MSVGGQLREAREAAGLTIADVARVTRVRGTLLSQMEADDFDACGGAVYARGHIRAFAAAVHVDGEPLVAEYDASHESVPLPVLSEELPAQNSRGIKERGRANWLPYAIGATIVLIAVLVVAAVVSPGKSKVGGLASAPSTAPTTAPSAAPRTSAAASPTPSQSPLVAQLAPVTVQVKITKPAGSWVSVNDGSTTSEQVLADGTTKIFTAAKSLDIRFGNAGAVDLTVNGEHVGTPGSDGQVIEAKFTPTSKTAQG